MEHIDRWVTRMQDRGVSLSEIVSQIQSLKRRRQIQFFSFLAISIGFLALAYRFSLIWTVPSTASFMVAHVAGRDARQLRGYRIQVAGPRRVQEASRLALQASMRWTAVAALIAPRLTRNPRREVSVHSSPFPPHPRLIELLFRGF